MNSGIFPDGYLLTAEYEDNYYVFISATLATSAIDASASSAGPIAAMYEAKEVVSKNYGEVEFVFSGVPFHSYSGAQTSKREIGMIANLSMLGLIILIVFTFRSLKPILLSLFSIGVGLLSALAVCFSVFGELHILTIVFGTTLIGVSIDYAFHFFAEYYNYKKARDGNAILRRIFPGITLGLVTSLMAYLALLIAPFPGLQQISLFSAVGLLGAYITVILFFPIVEPPTYRIRTIHLMEFSKKLTAAWQLVTVNRRLTIPVLITVTFIVGGMLRLETNDDIRLLYNTPKELLQNEILTASIMKNRPASQFLLIQQETPQALLEAEERMRHDLDTLVAQKHISSYQALSQIVPSLKRQTENLDLLERELFTPLLDKQSNMLDLSRREKKALRADILAANKRRLDLVEWLDSSQSAPFAHMWIGRIQNSFASVILLTDIKSIKHLEELAGNHPDVSFVDKVGSISLTLKNYRSTASLLVALVYCVIMLMLVFRYGYRKAALIITPPVLASLCTLAILGYLNIQLNLFNILALILVLGIGIDYTLFFVEGEKHQATTSLAILLSALTTILSFGLLALSSTPLTNSFGVTILIGIILAYLLAPLATCFKTPETAN
jgi:predicted exporter